MLMRNPPSGGSMLVRISPSGGSKIVRTDSQALLFLPDLFVIGAGGSPHLNAHRRREHEIHCVLPFMARENRLVRNLHEMWNLFVQKKKVNHKLEPASENVAIG